MNKTELVKAIAEKSGFSKKDADLAFASVIEVITETLVKGEKISIIG